MQLEITHNKYIEKIYSLLKEENLEFQKIISSAQSSNEDVVKSVPSKNNMFINKYTSKSYELYKHICQFNNIAPISKTDYASSCNNISPIDKNILLPDYDLSIKEFENKFKDELTNYKTKYPDKCLYSDMRKFTNHIALINL